jgi:hypothetical protein
MATQTLTVREPLPQDLKEKIVHLAVLRNQIHRYAAAFKKLSAEVNTRLAEQVKVRK